MLAEPKVHLKITGREERMGWKKSRQSVSWLTGRPLCIIERRNARERENGIDNPPRHCKYICHFKTCSSTTLQSLLPLFFFVPSNSSTCPARERGNALFQVPGQKKRALHFASLDEYVTGNAPREETSAPIRGRVLMSVRDFDASSSSYDSTTRHD